MRDVDEIYIYYTRPQYKERISFFDETSISRIELYIKLTKLQGDPTKELY